MINSNWIFTNWAADELNLTLLRYHITKILQNIWLIHVNEERIWIILL